MAHEQDYIIVKGAKEHNLKNIDIKIPRGQLVVLTGLSGSGKSSLAFDTIYAEGQRRYVESLSAYARQFLGNMDKPDVDSIEGLSPAISIDQKTTSRNPRSTVGTVTEIYDYLRLLYARIGKPYCPIHGIEIQAQSIDQMVERLLELPERTKIQILGPIVSGKKGTHVKVFDQLTKDGFVRVRVDGQQYEIDDEINLNKNQIHTIEVIVDRLIIREGIKSRLSDSLETALKLGKGKAIVNIIDGEDIIFSEFFACPHCDFSVGELEPRMFSFNSPFGACDECSGLGTKRKISVDLLIANKDLSISEGGIKGLENPDSYFRKLIKTTADYYNINIKQPIKNMTEEELNIILYGSKDEIHFKLGNERGMKHEKIAYFEGVIVNYERRYRETNSNFMRDWLEQLMAEEVCPKCQGSRLSLEALSVLIGDINISKFTDFSIREALDFINNLELSNKDKHIANMILKEIIERLSFLVNVGLDYLTLNRAAGTLSGGEAQRIRLATQIGSRLTGVLYVLDEPSIGLHQRDNTRLINTLKSMRDLGNTLLVVEHDEETMLEADHLIDIGPGAGIHGGQIIAQGTPQEVMKVDSSITGQYLSGKKYIPVPKVRREGNGKYIEIIDAAENNLQNIDVKIPLGKLVVVTGVSGSGKSTLINEILYKGIHGNLYKTRQRAGKHKEIIGLENIDKIIDIDQSPIGRTPRSNPATYTGVFDNIRDLYAETTEAKKRGYLKGRFSFNVKGGRCEACSGDGVNKIEMHFLPDVYVPCEVCHGKRYNSETLEVKYKDKNISDVLNMTVETAVSFFDNIPKIKNKLQTIHDVGLDYITLGQQANTLSGGEAQRVKLASELHKKITDKTLYILDEPTTGLHIDDISRLMEVLQHMVDQGATVLIIEHNLDVIKLADHIIDLGPEGGNKGGTLVFEGTPEEIVECEDSHTGYYLKEVLNNAKYE